MTVEVRVPQLPESVADATLVSWHKKPGDAVARDENLVDLETDKVVLEVPAPVAGVIKEIKLKDGTTVTSGQILAVIEEAASATPGVSAPAILAKETVKPAAAAGSPLGAAAAFAGGSAGAKLSPAARRVADENQIDPSAVSGSGRDGRISKSDVVNYLQAKDGPAGAPAAGVSSGAPAVAPPAVAPPPAVAGPPAASPPTGAAFGVSPVPTPPPLPVAPAPQVASAPAAKAAPATAGPALRSARADQRVPMTRLRARIAERMVQAQSTQALLTSFNEVDLKAVNDLRARYKEAFEKQHGIKLGFMSFFARACIEALKKFPAVNASVDGQDIVYHEYYDLGIAVSTDRGLIVPIVRDADQLSFAEMEKSIGNFATRARSGTITMQELSGGTFTITNGGIFGSLLSTPIVNFPQSAILGMHKIQDRPVVVDGEVVVRPMMYVALTYDHRIIDGREAVQFLVAVKQGLEDPARMVLGI